MQSRTRCKTTRCKTFPLGEVLRIQRGAQHFEYQEQPPRKGSRKCAARASIRTTSVQRRIPSLLHQQQQRSRALALALCVRRPLGPYTAFVAGQRQGSAWLRFCLASHSALVPTSVPTLNAGMQPPILSVLVSRSCFNPSGGIHPGTGMVLVFWRFPLLQFFLVVVLFLPPTRPGVSQKKVMLTHIESCLALPFLSCLAGSRLGP